MTLLATKVLLYNYTNSFTKLQAELLVEKKGPANRAQIDVLQAFMVVLTTFG